ncbi:MAG: ribonuclease III [Holosporales bacterium]|nr:ribonuclease III [Holosporales bacterium]
MEKNICYTFKKSIRLVEALHHSSIKKFAASFERLEFLGDRVLGLVSAEYIFKNFTGDEGKMAKMQSAFVCADACHKVATQIGISNFVKTAGAHLQSNKTVLADTVEALLGAIFVDGGYMSARSVILKLWQNIFAEYDVHKQEPKTTLQELCQEKTGSMPLYELISITGADHKPEVLVSVSAFGYTVKAVGPSKKKAETIAAMQLLKKVKK